MATLSIDIPDAIAPRLLDAVAARNGYDPAGGLTKTQFARRAVKEWLRSQLETYEGVTAAANAQALTVAAIRQELPDE